MDKFRMWIADRLIGSKPYIKNVTFHQTACFDMDSEIHLNNVSVELGHDIRWKNEKDGYGINFDYYKKSIEAKRV